jgi:methionine biosynthesis protein MetW
VSFPNIGHWRHRIDLALRGRMPVSGVLPYAWHETPNIHLCTVEDFERLLRDEGVRKERRILLDDGGRAANGWAQRAPNLVAAGAVYLLSRT